MTGQAGARLSEETLETIVTLVAYDEGPVNVLTVRSLLDHIAALQGDLEQRERQRQMWAEMAQELDVKYAALRRDLADAKIRIALLEGQLAYLRRNEGHSGVVID